MCNPPSKDGICQVLSRLNAGRTAGKNGLLPELLKSCDAGLLDYIHDLCVTVWQEEKVPSE